VSGATSKRFPGEFGGYYRLTQFGQRVVVAETRRFASLIGMARSKRLLSDVKFAGGHV
jgi:hypothetical protein